MKNILNFLKPRKKLHIFYKHVDSDAGKNRPEWFTHEICFLNLLHSIGCATQVPLDVDLTVLFDGTEESYQKNFISKYHPAHGGSPKNDLVQFDLQIFQGGSQRLAGLYLMDFVSQKKYSDNDYIYLLENDYLHDFGWVQSLESLIRSEIPFDYVSLYDHRDKYPHEIGFHEMHKDLQSKIYIAGNRHWRTVPSTCSSFILAVKTFSQDLGILKAELMDHEMFDALEKKGRILLSPIPGLATHCMINLLSPCIEWEKFLQPPVLPETKLRVNGNE